MANDKTAIVLKSYHDGSGKCDDPKCGFVTLASYSATNPTWDLFEQYWGSVLNKHRIPYFHMAEALAGKGPFSRSAGWDHDRVMAVAIELMSSLSVLPRHDFIATVCTVDVSGYREARKCLPKLRPLESICVDHCFGALFRRMVRREDGSWAPIETFFDKNETFLHWLDRVWRSKNAAKRLRWPSNVAKVASVEMRKARPVQAADIAAWTIREHYQSGGALSSPLHIVVQMSTTFIERQFGFDDIMREFKDEKWR